MSRIDVHGHCIPDAYRDSILDSPVGPTARIPTWSFDAHLKMMDENDIEFTVLSLAPPGIWFGDAEKTKRAARRCNDELADIVRRGNGRFGALGVVPLPTAEDACEEIIYALDTLKLDGVSLFASYGGEYLGKTAFNPALAELNKRKSVAFIHPNIHPANQAIDLPWPGFVIEYPFDTTRAATNLIFSGAMDLFPDIKFVLAHGGGTLPYLGYRLALVGSQQLAKGEYREKFPLPFFHNHPESTDPEFVMSYIRKFWFEIALSAGPGTLGSLTAFADPARIMFGSDWPYAPESILADVLKQVAANEQLTPANRQAIEFGNAQALFASAPKGSGA